MAQNSNISFGKNSLSLDNLQNKYNLQKTVADCNLFEQSIRLITLYVCVCVVYVFKQKKMVTNLQSLLIFLGKKKAKTLKATFITRYTYEEYIHTCLTESKVKSFPTKMCKKVGKSYERGKRKVCWRQLVPSHKNCFCCKTLLQWELWVSIRV